MQGEGEGDGVGVDVGYQGGLLLEAGAPDQASQTWQQWIGVRGCQLVAP